MGELTSWLLIAWSYAGEGELNPALKTLDRLDSNESFANFKTFHEALIADYLGNAIRAEGAYKKAYAAAPNSLRIVEAYGNFLERHNRAPEAQTLYRAYLAERRQPADRRRPSPPASRATSPSPSSPRRRRVPPRRCSRSPPR